MNAVIKPQKRFESLTHLLEYRANETGARTFLLSPEDRTEWSYAETLRRALTVAQRLRATGVSERQRVALVMENSPAWAAAFFGILLAGCSAVPLNPALTAGELEKMSRLAGARTRVSGNLEIAADDDASALTVSGDEALLLFTSGSTGAPKGVVLTHANLLAEAGFIRDGHALTAGDTALCVLPFFHINGLVITLLATALAGGRAVVPRKFSASQFWRWAADSRATWFSAVPTILTILLSTPRDHSLDISPLRFARSASAPLTVTILQKFENTFGVPVIEAYGLSEAGSQVATNPLPPKQRKAGSVGLPAGNELIVVDGDFNPLPVSVSGEVAVRGPNVSAGYWQNIAENEKSFRDGWFLTGDLGYFDVDGYLFLTGRKKELINRAGEKISPREIDEILYELPAVELAAAAGVPDELYGEEVAAFVQLRPGAKLDAAAVIQHCRARLAEFKAPKQIFFISDFPRGANDKIQRGKLAELYLSVSGARARKKFRVTVSAEGCKACGYCIEVCPKNVFTVSGEFNTRGYQPVAAARQDDCVGCLRCFYACPDFSIDVEPLTLSKEAA